MYCSKCYQIWYTMDNKENLILGYWKSNLVYGIGTTKLKVMDVLYGTAISDKQSWAARACVVT